MSTQAQIQNEELRLALRYLKKLVRQKNRPLARWLWNRWRLRRSAWPEGKS